MRHIEVGGIKRPLNRIRDRMYAGTNNRGFTFQTGPTPSMVDLSPHGPPIYDQGSVGSCTAHAWARLIEYLQFRLLEEGKLGPEAFASYYIPISRMGFYFNERRIRGTEWEDSGAALSDGASAASTWGIWEEKIWPYTMQDLYLQPTQQCYDEGRKHIISKCEMIKLPDGDLNAMKHCLAQGFPIVFGTQLYDSFQGVDSTGKVTKPDPNSEGFLGGHALTLMGYDDSNKVFKVPNSWGTSWGNNGYCFFPYDYIGDVSLTNDFWTARV